MTKESYLATIAPVVAYFRQFQNRNASSPFYGKIMHAFLLPPAAHARSDPYAGIEIQYSTPCFVNAAALLLNQARWMRIRHPSHPSPITHHPSPITHHPSQGYTPNDTYATELLFDATIGMTAALTALQFGQPVGNQGCAQGCGSCTRIVILCAAGTATSSAGLRRASQLTPHSTMPLMLAMRSLAGLVNATTLAQWHNITARIDPAISYLPCVVLIRRLH